MELKINIPDEEVKEIHEACKVIQLDPDKVIQSLVTNTIKSVVLIVGGLRNCLCR